MTESFDRANELWFHQARTSEALDAYGVAFDESPDDPVVAYQYARALSSVARPDQARAVIEVALSRIELLGPTGRRVIRRLARDLNEWRPPPADDIPLTELDRDVLERLPTDGTDWGLIAHSAAEREMFGVAVYALDRWPGVPLDGEDAREIDDIRIACANSFAMLAQMREEPPGEFFDDWTSTSTSPVDPEPVWPNRVERVDRPGAAAAAAGAGSDTGVTDPLSFTVEVSPPIAPAETPTTLEATLRNLGDVPVGVNRRLLLNNPGQPGEVWLAVDGPDGYFNSVGFRIRVGTCPDEFYVTLDPGASVGTSWLLDDYESIDAPGEYTVTLTYHQELPVGPKGIELATGTWVGSTSFTRT